MGPSHEMINYLQKQKVLRKINFPASVSTRLAELAEGSTTTIHDVVFYLINNGCPYIATHIAP